VGVGVAFAVPGVTPCGGHSSSRSHAHDQPGDGGPNDD
jgi:hypothetical protein